MPVGGGNFTTQNKILPGAYINFVSAGAAINAGTRGIAALPMVLDWGPDDAIFVVHSQDFNRDAIRIFGYPSTDPKLLLPREALKRASRLLGYKVNSGGVKANGIIGGIPVAAKYAGVRGNSVKVGVLTNVDDAEKVDVVTYLDTALMDTQTVAAVGGTVDLIANDYVTFGETGTIVATAVTALTGGTNGTATGQTYSNFLAALEVEDFNVVGYPGTDETVKSLFAAFVKRLRNDEGVKIVGVLHNYPGDDIGLINVKNGVVLADGTVVSGDKAVAWATGATAGAEVYESLTNTVYEGAVDADIRYTKSQFEAAVTAGEFVFYGSSNTVRVLVDINSLTTFSNTVSSDWTSNRVVRVMDGWANEVAAIFGSNYTGTVTNNDTGRQLFKADLVSLGNRYQAVEAISGFLSEDITVRQGVGKRDIEVDCALQINDAMEKLYMTVVVR